MEELLNKLIDLLEMKNSQLMVEKLEIIRIQNDKISELNKKVEELSKKRQIF